MTDPASVGEPLRLPAVGHGEGVEISVVIPTHNRSAHVLRTLRCALAQEGVRHEVIVVDDGSSDDTPAVLAEIGDPRLRVIRLETSGGVSNARNVGIANARAGWVAFLDDDDLWAPRKLRIQLDAAISQGVDALYCGAVQTNLNGEVLQTLEFPAVHQLPEAFYPSNPLPSGPSNVIARTEVVRRAGGFDEQFSFIADWDMWLALAGVGRFGCVPDVLVGYVDHQRSMTVKGSKQVAKEYRALVRKHSVPGRRGEFDERRAMRWRAAVHLGAGRSYHAAALFLRTGSAGNLRDLTRGTLLLAGTRTYSRVQRRVAGLRTSQPGRERASGRPEWLGSIPPLHHEKA